MVPDDTDNKLKGILFQFVTNGCGIGFQPVNRSTDRLEAYPTLTKNRNTGAQRPFSVGLRKCSKHGGHSTLFFRQGLPPKNGVSPFGIPWSEQKGLGQFDRSLPP